MALNSSLKKSMLLVSSWDLVTVLDPSLFMIFKMEFLDLFILVAMLKNLVLESPRLSHWVFLFCFMFASYFSSSFLRLFFFSVDVDWSVSEDGEAEKHQGLLLLYPNPLLQRIAVFGSLLFLLAIIWSSV